MGQELMTGRAFKRDELAGEILSRTPRQNRNLPQKLATFETLSEGLDYAAQC